MAAVTVAAGTLPPLDADKQLGHNMRHRVPKHLSGPQGAGSRTGSCGLPISLAL